MYKKNIVGKQLILFLCTTLVLILIGVIAVYSSSSVLALELYGNAFYFVKKQLFGITLGTIAVLILQFVPFPLIRSTIPLFYAASLALTALTYIAPFRHKVNGSARWVHIGITFQPSELLVIATILTVALLLEKTTHVRHYFVQGYLSVCMVIVPPCLLLLKQPDFGLCIAIIITTFTMLLCAQAELKHVGSTMGSLLPVIIGLILYKPYRFKRIMTFLNPWQDPQGAGFQIIQSLIAIGSGGLYGIGFGNSKQKFFYLPMQHTDFIFSIIAEETGFIGATFLICVYLFFLYTGFKVALHLSSQLARYGAIGFLSFIGFQTFMNIAVATGRIPTKGVGLPFISYGNTTLVCHLIMIGLMINFTRKNQSLLLSSYRTI